MLLHMYTPDRLMREARERLGVSVSDESISEAEGLGREIDDYTASEAGPQWRTFDEMYDSSHLLTDMERTALRAYIQDGRGVESVAEELGLGEAATYALLRLALDKLEDADLELQQRRYGEPARNDLTRFVAHHSYPNPPLKPRVDRLYAHLRGEETSIVGFTRSLLQKYPQIESIDRTNAGRALGDVTLELRFRPPVPEDYALRAVENAARETGVDPLTTSYSRFEP